jgi:hypothetical protein
MDMKQIVEVNKTLRTIIYGPEETKSPQSSALFEYK